MVTLLSILMIAVIVLALAGGLIAFTFGAIASFIPLMFKLGTIVLPILLILGIIGAMIG